MGGMRRPGAPAASRHSGALQMCDCTASARATTASAVFGCIARDWLGETARFRSFDALRPTVGLDGRKEVADGAVE